MKSRILYGVAATALLLAGSTLVAADLKSGLQVGEKGVPAFHPLHCTGPEAGDKGCLV